MSVLLEIIGVDGSVWDLRNGPVRGGLGIKGLGIIPVATSTRESASTDGQRRTGWRATAQTHQIPVKIGYWGLGTFDSFPALYRAWWGALRPHKYAQIRSTDLDTGKRRTATLRLTDDGREMEFDPFDVELEDTVMQLVADDPWWYGDPIGAGFGAVSAGNYYGGPNGGGYGPPYYVSSANSTGSQVVSNPGDVDAWPVWVLQGPLTGFDLVVGSAHITASGLNVLAGQQLVIDTDPVHGQTILWLNADGTPVAASGSPTGNVTRAATVANFAPIPAGSSTNVGATITGTGQASATIVPRYFDGI